MATTMMEETISPSPRSGRDHLAHGARRCEKIETVAAVSDRRLFENQQLRRSETAATDRKFDFFTPSKPWDEERIK
jgi:hypothetical protein